jgi:hypothetical protein
MMTGQKKLLHGGTSKLFPYLIILDFYLFSDRFQIFLVPLLELREDPKRTTPALKAESWTLSREALPNASPNKLASLLQVIRP